MVIHLLRRTIFAAVAMILMALYSLAQSSQADGADEYARSFQDSQLLVKAGDNAKSYVYELIEARNEFAESQGSPYTFKVVDARDSRLYAPGQPIQPRVPADLVIVKIGEHGAFQVLANIIDRPGRLALTEFPSGNLVTTISYGADAISYWSRFDGLYASVVRNSNSFTGWGYVYYLKGFGNAVSPQQFDASIKRFLENTVLYLTPL